VAKRENQPQKGGGMVEVKNLTKYYGNVLAVDNVSFKIEKGEVIGFLGPNGAGKTTTLRIITGFIPRTSGEVYVNGIPVSEENPETKQFIGYLPEDNPLYENLLAKEYLGFVADVRGVENKKERIDYVAEKCGITDVLNRFIGELSKGYRQRVGLAAALLHDPEILILDEPTSGLDPNQVVEIRNLIRELEKDKTVIISSHILQEVEALSTRVIIIHRGRIVADDRIENLSGMVEGKELLSVKIKKSKKDPLKVFSDLGNVGIIKEDAQEIELSIESAGDIREEVFKQCVDNGMVLLEMSRRRRSLEEIFRELTR